MAFAGHALHLALVASIATAAAAWTRGVAQATALTLAVSLGSWALDAGEECAALAWLRGRTVFDTIRNVATPTRTWHTLTVEVRGKRVRVELDGTTRFEKEYAVVRPGRVGLWSKADSQVLFDDLTVTRL